MPPRLADVAACVFDAYGTLYDFNSAAARCRAELGGKADELSALWRSKQLQYTWLRSLMGTYAPFWQVTGEALDFAMETLGIAGTALREKLMNLYRDIDAFPEVPGVLAELKAKGVRLAILSNGSPDMLAAAAKHSGLDRVLEASLSVDTVGIYKPDRRIYQLAADHFGLAPARIAFFSSNGWDAHGAAHFGFQTVWLNRTGQTAERLPGTPALVSKTLADLPALLGV
ncbi:MAG: haloacid dehalogenase type II [Rhodospirillaceae bacterium]|nr:haloacid dehalogenase type II [Rhodospirillaceae bacterium]